MASHGVWNWREERRKLGQRVEQFQKEEFEELHLRTGAFSLAGLFLECGFDQDVAVSLDACSDLEKMLDSLALLWPSPRLVSLQPPLSTNSDFLE